jgi:hypothetical protein
MLVPTFYAFIWMFNGISLLGEVTESYRYQECRRNRQRWSYRNVHVLDASPEYPKA